MKTFARLVCNLLPSGCRVDQLEGRDHIVVPMVILTEGVHKGSMGPLYYPKEELSKTPVVWNHKPIVVYHPTMNGEGISACDPVIINSRKVGVMLNTKAEDGKLKSEAWIEKDRANTVDDRIMAAVEAKEMMELSTGVFVDVEETSGKWKGEEYEGIARNFRPDHLALLPDQIGACSIADGAGFLRNQASASEQKGKDMIARGKEMIKKGKEEEDEDMIAKGKDMVKQGKEMAMMQKALTETLSKLGIVGNEMSYSNISSALSMALREKFKLGENEYVWVCDVYSNFVIYEYDGKLWRLSYTSNDVGVTLGDEAPTEVRRVTEYRTTEGTYVGNQEQTMNKKQVVDAIIAANTGWKETDRPVLMSLSDDQLKLIQNGSVKPAPPAPAPGIKEKVDAIIAANTGWVEDDRPALMLMGEAQLSKLAKPEPKKPDPAPAAPSANNVVTAEEYIKQAPKEIQEVLSNSIAVYKDERGKLVDAILANKNNEFTKQELEAKPLKELKSLARLAASSTEEPSLAHNRVPVYGGQAPVPTGNDAEEAMEVPVLNFAPPNRN